MIIVTCKCCLALIFNLQTNEGHQCVFMELFTKDFFNVYGSFKSVNEGRPQCLNILNDGSAEIKDFFGIPNNTCQFFWDMLSVCV